AVVQSSTIGACVAITWHMIPIQETRFFAAIFLASAGINAGLARSMCRPAANLRLTVYLATGFTLMAMDLRHADLARSRDYGFFAAGFVLLIYVALHLIRMTERNYQHRRDHEFSLLTYQYQQQIGQQRLAQSAADSQRLALVAKYARDSILILDDTHRIEWVNDAYTRTTGYTLDEAVGRYPGDLLNSPQTDPASLAKLDHSRKTQTPVRVEILNRAKDGRLMWMETSINPIFDAYGKLQLWVAVERDISEAKEREAELARARLTAEEAGKSKSRFLANMSHEIRTPMNGVIGVAELLAETPMSPAQAGYVETIRESGRALLSIINDILDLAKLQSGTAVLEALPFSAKDCIERVLRILQPEAQKKGLHLSLADPGPDNWVIGDEGKLRQVVMNLIGNALKFTSSGAVTLTMTLPTETSDLFKVTVEDTGIGIAPDRVQAIFDSFGQADDGISRQFGGTGLGLTICAMLAERMGGGIDVRSQVGTGSVFTLRARMAHIAAPELRKAQRERRAVMRIRQGLTVMAAEDNRTNMMILRKMLQGTVASLVEVGNGEQAVAAYRDDPPDIILMDISMPVKDGLQAARDIRAWELAEDLPRCPIVALTANAFGEDREACRLAGFDGFLVKPLSRIDLLAAIAGYFPEKALAEDKQRMAL
ncbi:MAG: response regulator, partial [Pseudorhodobacter sp.]|nr:response regulator [Pseudorhodobacter sp.]